MTDDNQNQIKGKMTPAKMIQDIESNLKQNQLNKIKEEAKKKLEKVYASKEVAINAIRIYQADKEDLKNYEAELTAKLKDMDLDPSI